MSHKWVIEYDGGDAWEHEGGIGNSSQINLELDNVASIIYARKFLYRLQREIEIHEGIIEILQVIRTYTIRLKRLAHDTTIEDTVDVSDYVFTDIKFNGVSWNWFDPEDISGTGIEITLEPAS